MKILLTGSTGYIGRRLLERLLAEEGISLRLFVTDRRRVSPGLPPGVEICEGTTFDRDALRAALDGVDTAYYLIHSMAAGRGDFEELDRRSAHNFIEECRAAGVRRVIYLGGLGSAETASRHLRSRLETGDILSRFPGEVQTLWFRAAVIIGSGGASFEIISHLIQKLPVMIAPRWVNTQTQPIALDDVLDYLVAAKDATVDGNLVIDIGAGRMSFLEMLRGAAKVFGLRRLIIPVPLFSPRLSSYWLVFITPVPYAISSALVEGLKSETVLQNDNARRYFPSIHPMPYERALELAVRQVEKNQVHSRWCDSTGGEMSCAREAAGIERAVFRFTRRVAVAPASPGALFEAVLSAGGSNGWYAFGMLWKLRGLMDKLTGGAGLNRGRRLPRELRVGDTVDFWRVVDLVPGRRLLLLSQMRLPGKGWIEFTIGGGSLALTAYFYPRGLLGRAYWYGLLPLHALVFGRMARAIRARALRDK